MLKPKEQAFANEYIINGGNAMQAALAAGYKINTAKNAYEWLLPELPNKNAKRHCPYKPEMRKYLDERLKELESEKTASAREVLEYLTSVLRGESESEVLTVELIGDGRSEAKIMTKHPDEKERLKAADSLAKILGISTSNVNVNGVKIVISGEDAIAD